ncbi:MAG: alcohol dehydrogenase catalytic domain-containing protein [Anaerolineales bacterium]|nr:alcohol dehydrogenase catalytic domain-containing protein [Anaerolineales bacterium]
MKAVSYQGKDSIELVDKPVPEATGQQALIKVNYAGICGTDLAIVTGKHPRATAPLVMGHEFAGVIAALPPDPHSDLKIGDRVTVYPLLSCGKCYICQMGLPHVCRNLKLIGIDTDGAFAEYVVAAEDAIFKIPDNLTNLEGALIEPLAVCIHAASMSRLQIGDTVVVTGAGPIGLLMAQVARAAGAAQIIVTEVATARIETAQAMGFTVLNAAAENLVQQVLDMTQGRGGDIVFEATGHPSVAPYLMELVRIRGQLVQLGIFKQPVALDLRALNFKEVDLIGSRVYTREDYERAISLAAAQKFDLKAVVSRVRPLAEAVSNFEDAKNATSLKVMFEVEPS